MNPGRRLLDWLVAAPALALGLGLARLEPVRALAVGAALGRSWLRLGGPRVGVARRNLELAFPEWNDAKRASVLRDHFEHMGCVVAETALLHGRHRGTLLGGFRIEGIEHYESALAAERAAGRSGGMLVLTAHFGSWELGGLAMADRGFPLSAVHHEVSNEPLRDAIQAWRVSTGMETLELGRAGLSLFRALSRGRLVLLLCDQNAGRDEGPFVPFFGEPAATRDGPIRIAMARGVPMLPVFCFREAIDPVRHVVRVFPPLHIESEGNDPDAALRANLVSMNGAIEAAIRMAPEQWLWTHKRWRRRPPGAPPVYSDRDRRSRTSPEPQRPSGSS